MSRLRDQWIGVVNLFRTTRQVIQAQRDIRRAHRLQREGQHAQAFRVAVCAFGTLSELAAADNPAASAILSTETVLLDELARHVGQPGAAREQLEQALAICEDVSARAPKLEPTLREYVVWYKHRLGEQPVTRPN